MARGALNRVLAAALGFSLLAAPLGADVASEAQAARETRVQEDLWQVLVGQRAVRLARQQLGKPYVWGDKTGAHGFDCSGFTSYVYRCLGVPLGVSALLQYQAGQGIDKGALQAGDLVFFLGDGSPLHVGIYEGDGFFLHAPGAGKVIERARLDAPYFTQRYVGARRPAPGLGEERARRAGAAAAAPPLSTPTPEAKP
jgi:cell wall-associated NlpC family hydrolase